MFPDVPRLVRALALVHVVRSTHPTVSNSAPTELPARAGDLQHEPVTDDDRDPGARR